MVSPCSPPGTRIIVRQAALIAKVAASTAIAQPAPAATTSTPAASGPRISPVDAGLKKPVEAPVTPASAPSIQSSAVPVITSAAIVP